MIYEKNIENPKLKKANGGFGYEDESQPLIKAVRGSSRHKVCADCGQMYPEDQNECPFCHSHSIKKII